MCLNEHHTVPLDSLLRCMFSLDLPEMKIGWWNQTQTRCLYYQVQYRILRTLTQRGLEIADPISCTNQLLCISPSRLLFRRDASPQLLLSSGSSLYSRLLSFPGSLLCGLGSCLFSFQIGSCGFVLFFGRSGGWCIRWRAFLQCAREETHNENSLVI